ncbi:MAG: DNA cytosine methyltransferase [Clostridia bacterium]|nr:DNA cytosine methyltransferase [Clostridia bacterium]
MGHFRFIDLFAGIGGFHQALTLYGGQCVFASELDLECKKQYEEQFRMEVNGDINKCLNEIPPFDVLCAGFPCQTFSKAGNQEGFDDKVKGQLFFRIVDILELHPECKFIILENVRNLADQKEFWEVIQDKLMRLDFYITQDPIICSPSDFGIPQNRERVYILGIKKSLRDPLKLTNGWIHTKDLCLTQFEKKCDIGDAFKILEYDNIKNRECAIGEQEKKVLSIWEEFKSEIIPHCKIGAPIWLDYFGIGIDNEEEFRERCGYYTQLVKARKKHIFDFELREKIDASGMILEDTPDWKRNFIEKNRKLYLNNKIKIDEWYNKYSAYLTNKVYRKFEWNCGPDYISFKETIIQFRQSGIRIKRSDTFPSLVAIVNTPIIWDSRLNLFRRISIREAANLQSFVEKYKFICERHISYKQLGNSVNVEVIKIIAKQLFNLAIKNWEGLNYGTKEN